MFDPTTFVPSAESLRSLTDEHLSKAATHRDELKGMASSSPEKLIDKLEQDDDIQKVFHNLR